jgi:hypothetical protein
MCGPSCKLPSLDTVRKQRAAPSALCATMPIVFIFLFSHNEAQKHKIKFGSRKKLFVSKNIDFPAGHAYYPSRL